MIKSRGRPETKGLKMMKVFCDVTFPRVVVSKEESSDSHQSTVFIFLGGGGVLFKLSNTDADEA